MPNGTELTARKCVEKSRSSRTHSAYFGGRHKMSAARHSQNPRNPFHAGEPLRGFHGSHICYGLPVCSPLCTDPTGFPAVGDFYVQAFDGLVALPAAGYDYSGGWTPPLVGLAPTGTTASLAARHLRSQAIHPVPLLRSRTPAEPTVPRHTGTVDAAPASSTARAPACRTISGLPRGLNTCCLRFENDVATIPARLASGWLAHLCREGVEPSGLQ